MATAMCRSRPQLDWLLDPQNAGVALHTLFRGAPCWASGCGWSWWGRAAISTDRRVAR
ncbi:MAG TPA: hypothetical protein VK726_17060 [Acetobacteraceae bacterium]|nr:hypothetical protein [Acetobacteraceae bacterium]